VNRGVGAKPDMGQQVRIRLQEWNPFAGRTVAQVEKPFRIELEHQEAAAGHVGDAVAGSGADQDQVLFLQRDHLLLQGQLAMAALEQEQFQTFMIMKHDPARFAGPGLVDENSQMPRWCGRIRSCLVKAFHGAMSRGLSVTQGWTAPPAASIPASEPWKKAVDGIASRRQLNR